MARRKPTLEEEFASLVPFRTSGAQWKKIEETSGLTISPDFRRAIVARTQRMHNRTDAWQSALPIPERVRLIAGIRRTTVDWLKWIDGLPPELEARIMSLENSDRAEDVIKPFMKGIIVSCDERLAELVSIEPPDARHPWETWIIELTKLFKQHGLRATARKDVDKAWPGRHSKFVIFVYELQRLIERQYRRPTGVDADDPDKAKQALADAITRARSPRRINQRRGNRRSGRVVGD